jgi:HD-GYP domain-containing protein (c-di-GMP phosphodiesterase class II)
MASGIIHYASSNSITEKPLGSSVPFALPSFLSIFYAILDELLVVSHAEAVAVVKNRPQQQNEFTIEIGLGDWSRLAGTKLPLDEEMLAMITTAGNFNINQSHFSTPILAYSHQHSAIQNIYHFPLLSKMQVLGAIWVGHRTTIPLETVSMLNSITEMLAHTLSTTKLERSKEYVRDEAIQTLLRKLVSWDVSTFNHSIRMVPWAMQTAIKLNCSEQDIRIICLATLLHDIGKICIPKSILHKAGPLSTEEWALMKLHPVIGSRMISTVKALSVSGNLIESHHEKFDGSGYPYGLKGEEIPLGGRILAVADAYGSMTEERNYKKALGHQQAENEIHRCAGAHFDPEVVDAFLSQFYE